MPEGEVREPLTPFKAVQMRARKGLPWIIVFSLALFMAFLEIFYVMNFYSTVGQFIELVWSKEASIKYMKALFVSDRSIYGLVMASLTSIGFLIFPARKPNLRASEEELRSYMKKYVERIPWYDILLAVVAIIVFAYHAKLGPYVEANEGELPPGSETRALIASILGFALVFELTRRAVGPWLVAVAATFLGYYFYFWRNIPPYDLALKWAKDMFYATEGLFNIPFQVMAMYVFAFLFFGTFLEMIGIGEYITTLMLSYFGGRPGGPAKVAIVSSGFMGMLSGSSVANVFTTGVFTIPLMKKSGFPPEIAGAVEASASTGGQIMPPIMGAAAFIMAAYLGRPYGDIVIAAFLPAFIYFLSLYFQIDLEAKRRGLRGLPPEQLPARGPLLRKSYLLLPLIAITVLLVLRLPPQHSVVASLSTALVVALWAMDVPLSMKVSYTIALGILLAVAYLVGMKMLAAIYFTGITFLLASALLVFTRTYRHFGLVLFRSIEQAVRNSIPVFMAAALAGVVQGTLTGTGLSTVLGEKLVAISHGQIYLLLAFAGLLSILVGMGVPTTANYVITSLLSAGAIVKAATRILHLAPAAAALGAHMFVFYYGILADLTPPVALAAFAGATVARADFWKTAVNATRFGFAKYILPFVFAVNPALLIIPILESPKYVAMGFDPLTWADFAWALATVAAVLVAASAAFAGYLGGPINNRYWRALLVIVGVAAVTGKWPLVLAALVLAGITYPLSKRGRL
jgi:TRAP transporter 4TM/12TM fusion protein